MMDYLLSGKAKKLRDEIREFVRWVPREMILEMDKDTILSGIVNMVR